MVLLPPGGILETTIRYGSCRQKEEEDEEAGGHTPNPFKLEFQVELGGGRIQRTPAGCVDCCTDKSIQEFGGPGFQMGHGNNHIGKYRLGRTVGEGTFAKVKLAVDGSNGTQVAIKIIDKQMVTDSNLKYQASNTLTRVPADDGKQWLRKCRRG